MHAICSQGGRANNQDAWHAELGSDCFCCVVCDGAGGHSGGAEAARLATDAAIRHWRLRPQTSPANAVAALDAADRAVRGAQQEHPELSDMRTTGVVLEIEPSSGLAAWASVGDSRLYFFRGREEPVRTRDHSLVEELLQAGLLSGDPSRTHPRRNVLTAALGGLETVVRPGPEGLTLASGDALLLCSDGFWEYVFEPEIQAALLGGESAQRVLDVLERLLLQRAPPAHDNYTAILVRVLAAN
jgi:serine/threonine protein phosphatase PrpC